MECVGLCCLSGELSEWKLGHIFCFACATIGDPYLSCRCSQNGKSCVASILLADVVPVGSGVVGYRDRVCVKADVFVFVDRFNRPVESGAQTVCCIASTLGETNACCAAFVVGSIDGHTFLIAVVSFGQAGSFILCEGDAVIKEQVIAIAKLP